MQTRERGKGTRVPWAQRALVVLVLAVTASATLALAAPTTGAQEVGGQTSTSASGGSLSWGVSTYAWTSSSLGATIGADAPASADTTSQTWNFGDGTGSYDPDTGATSVSFAGALLMGNISAGNLGVRIADPVLTVAADGTGALVGDVSTRGPGGPGPMTPWGTPVPDVVVATFTVSSPTVVAGHVSWTVIPDYSGNQFPQPFLDAVGASFAAFFKATGGGSDAAKVPTAITVGLDFDEPTPPVVWSPQFSASKSSDVSPDGETVTVTGSGFEPAANTAVQPPLSGSAAGFYLVFGRFTDPWRPSEGGTSANRQQIDTKWVLPASSRAVIDPGGTNADLVTLESDGTFTATLDLAEATGTGAYGIATYAAGGAVNAAQELFTTVTFAAPAPPGEPTTPTEPDSDVPTGPAPLGGGLDWGVKESFRHYVTTIAAGTISMADGATANANGTFHFPLRPGGGTDADGDLHVAFAGSVAFTGHGGLLSLRISDLRVETDGPVGALIADVESLPLETGSAAVQRFDDIELARLDLGPTVTVGGPTVVGASRIWENLPATLTDAGAPAFSGFYTAGTAVDAATVTLVGAAVTTSDGTGPGTLPLAFTGGSGSTTLMALALVLIVVGALMVVAARRRARVSGT